MSVANDALYRLMLEIDKHEDLDNHPIRETDAYKNACKVLGWDIDWEKLYGSRG